MAVPRDGCWPRYPMRGGAGRASCVDAARLLGMERQLLRARRGLAVMPAAEMEARACQPLPGFPR
jgi:hypothetical protein